MTKFYKATFSNGEVFLRSSTSRIYAAAYVLRSSSERSGYRTDGFSGSELLAHKALGSARAYAARHGYTIDLAEVAPAIEITGPEHRDLRKAGAR